MRVNSKTTSKRHFSIKEHDSLYQDILDYLVVHYPDPIDFYPRDLPFFDSNNFHHCNLLIVDGVRYLQETGYLRFNSSYKGLPIQQVVLTPFGYKEALSKTRGLLSGSVSMVQFIRNQTARVRDEGLWLLLSESIRALVKFVR
ncbi:hypothetical protein EV696_1105 [Permianibacter aggregans]|uniref:Uncharacterized protein n=1 Tax=Permianibacter aggregans TaxID=1510150 RepID=A0A4R6UPL4_9GAMM|nr:hypothetical protein EV696_1105 [Permianibacter aggregans]